MARVLRWPGKLPDTNNTTKPKKKGFFGWLARLFLPNNPTNETDKGLSGEWKVATALERYLDDRWTVANNVKIPLATGKSQIDHLLFGFQVIYCIETKSWNTAACNEKGEWFRFQGRMWIPQESPVEQNQRKVEQLSILLRKQGITTQIQNVIVFANPGKFDFGNASLPQNTKVFGLPGFIEYLNQLHRQETTYTHRTGQSPDPERILSLIR